MIIKNTTNKPFGHFYSWSGFANRIKTVHLLVAPGESINVSDYPGILGPLLNHNEKYRITRLEDWVGKKVRLKNGYKLQITDIIGKCTIKGWTVELSPRNWLIDTSEIVGFIAYGKMTEIKE